MRTPEEIMKAMEFCTTHETCEGCPYQMYNTDKLGYDEPICVNRLLADTICHVRQLEADKNELLAEYKQLKETVTGAAPMVRARWDFRCRHIRTEIWEWRCSACGELPPGDNRLAYTLNYCPNCGAKMDVVDKQTQSHTPRWISVKERLPDNDIQYLTYTTGREYVVCYYNGDGDWISDWASNDNPNVTHWMELPKQPEEE